jgi:hypothetical protein
MSRASEEGGEKSGGSGKSRPRTESGGATTTEPPPPNGSGATGDGPSVTLDVGVVKGLARSASRIVSQAATILEEELAAGIGAAKEIEARFLNVAEMRSTNPAEVMARFRKDAHEVVDIVIDLLNAPTKGLNDLAQRISVGGEPGKSGAPVVSSDSAPTISVPGDVPAGESGTVPFSLENDSDAPTAEFEFQATDLVNAEGQKILGKQVTFEPAKLTIPAHNSESVTINVKVPKDATPGLYSGLVIASKLERLRAVLVVSVP